MKNRKLLLIVSLVLALTMSLGGTLAYLQDTDADVNVMTLGNVDIEQHEYERAKDESGNYETTTVTKADGSTQESYELQEFTQDKPLLPAVGDPNGGYTDMYARFEQLDSAETVQGGQAFLKDIKNAQDKIVLVENTGKTDAYVRTLLAFELGSKTVEDWNALVKTCFSGTVEPWKLTGLDGAFTINSNEYVIFEAVYSGYSTGNMRHKGGILPDGEWTYNNLAEIYLVSEATNEDLEALDGNKNGKYDILVLSQAVQADGFDDADQAFQIAFDENNAQPTEALLQDWFADMAEKGPSSGAFYCYTSADSYWGETWANAKKSYVIKVYAGDTYMGESSLNNIDNIIDGDLEPTWNLKLQPTNSEGSYWTTTWDNAPTWDLQPDKAELWIDGKKVAETNIQMNGPDNLNKIAGAVVDASGKILRYVVAGTTPTPAEGEEYKTFPL